MSPKKSDRLTIVVTIRDYLERFEYNIAIWL